MDAQGMKENGNALKIFLNNGTPLEEAVLAT
jgi:hypothetical protein